MKAIGFAAALAAVGIGLAAHGQELLEGYTCCNLHYDKDWISDANWRQLPLIPAGSKIKITSYGWNNRANAQIDGREMRIGHDYGRNEEKLEQYVAKLVVKKDPRAAIARYPAKIRDAIKDGTVIPGMTREQVIISIGYPPTHRTPRLDAPVWNLWASRAGRYEVHFSGKGVVDKIVGTP
jgi:hypothetical protein